MLLKSLTAQDIELQILEAEVQGEDSKEVLSYLKLTYVGEGELSSGWRVYFSLGLDLADDEQRVDKTLIDGWIVNGSARLVGWLSTVTRTFQTGYIYHYAFTMIVAVALYMGYLLMTS